MIFWVMYTPHPIWKGADINKADISNNTPLHRAAYNGRSEIVKYLLSKGTAIVTSLWRYILLSFLFLRLSGRC